MKVIFHQYIGMNLYAVKLNVAGKYLQKSYPVVIISEYISFFISTTRNMVPRFGKFYTDRSYHGRNISRMGGCRH